MADFLSRSLVEWGQIAVLLFFAIAMIQSGLDKVTDWNGNLEWLKGHFGASPLKSMVPLLVGTLTFFECVSGGAALIGAILIFTGAGLFMAQLAMLITLATLLMLFFGQRVAKDYAGAAVIAAYFVVALVGVLLLAQPAS